MTLTLNFGGEGVVPDRRGLKSSSIYGVRRNHVNVISCDIIHVLCSTLLQGVHVGHALAPAAPAQSSRDASRVRGLLRAKDVDSNFL